MEVCWIFLELQHGQIAVLEFNSEFCPVDWNWLCVDLFCVCVDNVSDWGWSFGEGANFHFSWGTKLWHYEVEGAVWCKVFCTLTHCPFSRPHDTEICDLKLCYLICIGMYVGLPFFLLPLESPSNQNSAHICYHIQLVWLKLICIGILGLPFFREIWFIDCTCYHTYSQAP